MTDHRTEAERWLDIAKDPEIIDDEQIIAALVGIGHALLANLPPQVVAGEGRPMGEPKAYRFSVDVERCPWWTNGEGIWALWAGPPSKRRCMLYAGHDGDHRDLPTQP